MVLDMTDYVMYDGGEMWVPVGDFAWTVDAQIDWLPGHAEIRNIVAPSVTKFAAGSTWPSWSGQVSGRTWH